MSYDASFYLICRKGNRGYNTLSVRIATRKPALEPGEVPIYLTVSLPGALFQKPQLHATVTIADQQVPPAEIIAKVVGNIQEQLRQALGVEVKLTVEAPPE